MVGKRILLYAMTIYMFISCHEENTLNAKFVRVDDSKPCTDSLYEVNDKIYNARKLDFTFLVKNNTYREFFVPIRTLSDESVYSYVKVFFVDKGETIIPKYEIKKIPYDSNIVNPNDSMWIIVHVFRIPDWQKGNITVNTSVFDMVDKLRVEYCKNPKDNSSSLKQSDLFFEKKSPNVEYYELPRGGVVDPM